MRFRGGWKHTHSRPRDAREFWIVLSNHSQQGAQKTQDFLIFFIGSLEDLC
jgi:hypothetical protein